MRKITVILFIFWSLLPSYAQTKLDKKDKRLIKKVKLVETELKSIYKTITQHNNKEGNKGFNKRLTNALLTKEDVTAIESSDNSVKRIDSMVEHIKKEEPSRYISLFTVSYIEKITIEKEIDKLLNLFATYGYPSKSRLEKLHILEKTTINIEDVLLAIPSDYHEQIRKTITIAYKNNRLTNAEYTKIIDALKNN